MTENKRFYIQGIGIADRERKRLYDLKTVDGFISVRDLLNEQEERIQELETVMRQILYETRANYTKEEYSVTVSISPQMHDKLTELITGVK